jgi:hypothetical protein
MKQKNRICIYLLIGFLLVLATNCKKDKTLPDYASKIAGTYNGTVTVIGTGTAAGSSTLTKSSEQVVDLEIIIGSSNIPLDGIDISSDGDDIYNLKYTDSSGSFIGKVEGNKLTWTLTAGSVVDTFTGSK